MAGRRKGDSMKPTTFSIPVFSLRRIETPYERAQGYKNYLAVVDARQLPDLSDWREINVRDAQLRGPVPSPIPKGVPQNAEEFFFINRGLVPAAEKVQYRPDSKKKGLVLRDPAIH